MWMETNGDTESLKAESKGQQAPHLHMVTKSRTPASAHACLLFSLASSSRNKVCLMWDMFEFGSTPMM